jgi:hypothetical protein
MSIGAAQDKVKISSEIQRRGRRRRRSATAVGAVGAMLGASLLAPGVPAFAAGPAAKAGPAVTTAVTVTCTSRTHPALAAQLARDIAAARRARGDTVALVVEAPTVGVSCSLSGAARFDQGDHPRCAAAQGA